jgi:hypothetical protein
MKYYVIGQKYMFVQTLTGAEVPTGPHRDLFTAEDALRPWMQRLQRIKIVELTCIDKLPNSVLRAVTFQDNKGKRWFMPLAELFEKVGPHLSSRCVSVRPANHSDSSAYHCPYVDMDILIEHLESLLTEQNGEHEGAFIAKTTEYLHRLRTLKTDYQDALDMARGIRLKGAIVTCDMEWNPDDRTYLPPVEG